MKKLLIFIISIVFVYLVFHFFFRYLLPWVVKKGLNKIFPQNKEFSNKENSKKPGETTLDYMPPKSKANNSDFADDGEYINFEEIHDEENEK